MQAVIMAGGKGTRLSSVTRDVPKPMVLIDGKPLLEHQIGNLKECGITDVILVTGYLGDVIEDYFGDGHRISPSTGKPFGVNISYYSEEIPLGTAGALGKIKDRLQENFVLLFGDLFTCIDYRRFIEFHKTKNADITLFVHPNSHPYDSDIVITDSDSKVIGWSYKNTERKEYYKNLVNAGIYVLGWKITEYVWNIQLCGKEKVDLEKDVITKLLKSKDYEIYGYKSSEYVKDLGTPERLEVVTKDYFSGICSKKNLLNKQKCIFLDRDGTVNKYVGFLRNAEQMELAPTVAEAIRKINGSEYLAVIITNQPVIARGECSFEELERIHNKMYTLLGNEGAYVDGLYFCPHHPDSGFEGEIKELKIDCDCRKPKTGLLERAAEDLNIDLGKSWFIGDTYQDVQTGINAGMKTLLLSSGDENKINKYGCIPDYVVKQLDNAVEIILKKECYLMQYNIMNTEEQKNLIKSYFDKEMEAIEKLDIEEINAAVSAIWSAYERKAVIYIFGNGGSAATASHFVCDFNKGISENKARKFNFVCLNDNVPTMMAIANDVSYDEVFRYQLDNKLKPTDLVIGISGSGNSKNVINAVEYAKKIGAPVIGITGYNGGRLKELADYHMDANIDDMQISEDLHMIFDHMMYFVLNYK